MNKTIIILFITLLGCQSQTLSPQEKAEMSEKEYANALKLIHNNRLEQSIPLLKNCASSGHGGCAQTLGAAYYTARGVPFNLDEAIRWQIRAWKTRAKHRFAGLYSAMHLAAMMCDKHNKNGGYDKFLFWIQNSKSLVDELRISRASLSPVEGRQIKVVLNRIKQLEELNKNGTCQRNQDE